MPAAPADRLLPPRLLPILYVAAAHLSLALACGALAFHAGGLTGFFYQPRMLAIVHLVTVGWISASILGALYLVGPIALRVRLEARWDDSLVFVLVAVGIAGMATHFWIGEYDGMGWSGATAGTGIVWFGARHLPALARARVPAAVRLHIVLAFANIAAAATLGVLLGFNKVHPFLPGYVMSNVYAHAHLAAIGWASMMVVGVAYRLLPMVLPAAMPPESRLWTTAVLLQVGVTGLFVALLTRSSLLWIFAFVSVGGFAAFLSHAMWMLRHPKPRPPAIRTPDPAVLHAASAFLSLAIASTLGCWLAIAPVSSATPRIAAAYGAVGLGGFLTQIVVAMEGRLLPIFAWYWAFARSGGAPVPSPHVMPWRPGQLGVWLLWQIGVPSLACGMALDVAAWVRAGAWALLAATILNALQAAHVLRYAWLRPAAR
jgi:hypothetical protein